MKRQKMHDFSDFANMFRGDSRQKSFYVNPLYLVMPIAFERSPQG